MAAGSEHRILCSNAVAAVALSHELRHVAVAAFRFSGAAIVRRSQVKLECLAVIGSGCRWSTWGAAITVQLFRFANSGPWIFESKDKNTSNN